MHTTRSAVWFLALPLVLPVVISGALGLGGCGRDKVEAPVAVAGSGAADDGELGSASLALSLPGGSALGSIRYVISATGFDRRTGAIDVGSSATVSAILSLPAGGAYTIALDGASLDGALACAGSATFSVVARQTTAVVVHLTCHESAARTGSVAITGSLNVCPRIDGVSASPAEALVGGSVALGVAAHDTDAGPSSLTYSWSASSGILVNPMTSSPTFTCTAPGAATVTATVSDGDLTAGCPDTQAVTVTCSKATATLAVFGDWPYGTVINGATSFIAEVNADPDVELALHVGDIHSGSQACGDAYNLSIYGFFQTFADPVVYTPGDNEWTDCQKVKEMSSGAPLLELAKLRRLFFAQPGQTLGLSARTVTSQASAFDPAHPEDAAYVENVSWQQANVRFVTLNVPGSNDDHLPWAAPYSDVVAQADEIVKRDAANGRWLAKAFAAATSAGNAGIVIGLQADMWDPAAFAAGGDGLGGYDALVQQLATLAVAFGKPVLLINGDSHLYESDQPLADPASATGVMHPVSFPVPNLMRITVDGSTNFHDWVKLVVDPATPAVFSWTRVNTP